MSLAWRLPIYSAGSFGGHWDHDRHRSGDSLSLYSDAAAPGTGCPRPAMDRPINYLVSVGNFVVVIAKPVHSEIKSKYESPQPRFSATLMEASYDD